MSNSINKYSKILSTNTKALNTLDERYKNILTSKYYKNFSNEGERLNDLSWVTKVKKRVLKMRYRVLENMQREIGFEMNHTSIEERELNISAA